MTESVKGFQTSEGTKQYDYNALANKPTLITQTEVDAAINTALAQAKASGDFNGPQGEPGITPQKGVDYFTEVEIQEIVNQVAAKFTNVSEVGA